jgi:hypothetical protein
MARTLTAGYTPDGRPVHQLCQAEEEAFYSDFVAFIDHLRPTTPGGARLRIPPDLATCTGDWERYAWGIRYACKNRRLITCTRGSLGLGPACAAVGDIVCVFKGRVAPHVLRRVGSEFHYLGESYIDEVMQGQIAGSSSEVDHEWQTVTLK